MNFAPFAVIIIVWLLIGLPLSLLNKAAKQQKARSAKPGAANQPGAAAPEKRPEARGSYAASGEPARPTVMQPTITVTEHDDSVYQGSMNAVTGEGYDPCHDEQLEPLTHAETAVPAAAEGTPGLQLSFSGSEVVRGLVMSEILKRK